MSFRYYLVTIVAIFLALGLGVLAGTTVLDESLVQGLENRTEQLRENLAELREQVTGLQLENEGLIQVAEDVTSLVAPGRLAGKQVIMVTQEEVDGSARAQALEALESAGADLLAMIIVRGEMAAIEPAGRERLAEILGLPATTASVTLSREAALRLAQRLGEGSRRPGDLRPDILEGLVAGDFIEADAPALADGSASELGGPDAVVVVGGGDVELAPPPRDFLLPFTEELVREDTSVAAGESRSTSYPFVASMRSPEGFGDGRPMVSVDNVDQPTGKLALILGLERLLDLGEGGHYGLGGNVDGVIPPLDVAA